RPPNLEERGTRSDTSMGEARPPNLEERGTRSDTSMGEARPPNLEERGTRSDTSMGETRPINARERSVRFRALVREAPEEPGVYLMKDAEGLVIYVGKAKVLRNRLSSYFSGRKDVKTRHLVARIETIEWIIAASEYEALLLESTLIKRLTPRYNINLKDGKTYPSIRITNEAFPRVFRTRRIIDDGSRYFGPFPSADLIDTYLDLVKRLFPLRRCVNMKAHKDVCMYWHIGRCAGPCVGKITREEYAIHIAEVEKLLSGDTEALLASLRERMAAAAGSLKFEEAARLRDSLRAIEDFRGKTGSVDNDPEGRDYIAWAADGELVTFAVFQMRGGSLTGRDLYRSCVASAEDEALVSFLMSYYGKERLPPAKVFVSALTAALAEGDQAAEASGVPLPTSDLPLVETWFERELGVSAAIITPAGFHAAAGPAAEGHDTAGHEKRHAAALAMAAQNAHEDLAKRRRELGDPAAIAELKSVLGLSRAPERIEGFDIAHLEGRHMVASLVSFRNGIPDRKNYRSFNIRSLEGKVDDFAAIREAVARRYTRLVNEDAELPDLVLVDGGRGQVSAAKEILDALGLDCDLAGLAKRQEEIWLPGRGEAVVLPHDSPALRVLVAVRDETHRFATGRNQRQRAGELKFGILESVEGVGPQRAGRLLRVFGSLELIGKASVADIASAGKLGATVAERIKSALAGRAVIEPGPAAAARASAARGTATRGAGPKPATARGANAKAAPQAAAPAPEGAVKGNLAAEREPDYKAK
ncbi:MAG: excinuclease ABC subunit UvrC, partial [Rectinemataceae bacterium]